MEKVKCNQCGTENPGNYKYCFSCGYELPKITTEIPENPVQQSKTKKQGNRKNTLGILVGVITFSLSFFAAQQLFFKVPSLDKAMMKMAGEINKTCPVMIDSETRLDNAIALPKNTFQYNYTLIHLEKASTDTTEMRKVLEPNIVNTVKTNPQMQFQREHKTTLNYYYKDKDGAFLLLISITPDKYK